MTFDQELLRWGGEAADGDRSVDAGRVSSIAAELANGFEALAAAGGPERTLEIVEGARARSAG